jgi:hypothetical protein
VLGEVDEMEEAVLDMVVIVYLLRMKIQREIRRRIFRELTAAATAADPFRTSPGRKGRTAATKIVASGRPVSAISHNPPAAKMMISQRRAETVYLRRRERGEHLSAHQPAAIAANG